MELRQINTFMTIAKLQSFTKTALELGYAQSSITSQIQLLEQELNVRLFERLGHKVALTSEGKKLLLIAEKMMLLSNDAKNIAGNSDIPRGRLSIGAVESLCATWLTEILKEYRLRYPEVDIVIKFGSKFDFIRSLKDNTLDIAFFLDQKINDKDYITALQIPEPMVLLCSPEHAIAGKEGVYPEDLSGEALILTEPCCGYRILFDTIMSQYHVKPGSVIETGNVETIKQLTIGGMGIAFIPQTSAKKELQQKQLVKLNWMGPDFPIFTQALYHKTKWISAALNAFITLIQE